MISIWEEGMEERQKNSLKKDKSCEVLIIGGGLTGLFTALFCQNMGCNVMVVEEGTIEEEAFHIDFLEREELELCLNVIREQHLKCKFTDVPIFKERKGAFFDTHKKGAVFHPLRLVYELASRVPVYEEMNIEEIGETKMRGSRAYISFEQVLDLRKECGEQKNWCAMEGISQKEGIYEWASGVVSTSLSNKILVPEKESIMFPDGIITNRWKQDMEKEESLGGSLKKAVIYAKDLQKNLLKMEKHTKI